MKEQPSRVVEDFEWENFEGGSGEGGMKGRDCALAVGGEQETR